MKKLSRRKFLAVCAGALAVAGGGLAAAGGRLMPEAGEKAAEVLGHGRFDALRQIVASDNTASRTIMWQSPAPLSQAAVELFAGRAEAAEKGKELRRFPAQEEAFTDDGVTRYLYTATLTGLEAGKEYAYRAAAGGQKDDWHTLRIDDGKGFRALVFPDSQSSDYSGWKQLAQQAYARNPEASFFVNMGDLVDNGEDHTQWSAWFDAVDGIIDAIPVAPLMGNHETYDGKWKVREPLAYLHAFSLPENGSRENANRYYAFDYGPVHFIVLDTQQGEEEEFHPHLMALEQEWFKEDVRQTKKPWKVVLIYRNRGHIQGFERSEQGPLYILTGVAGDVRYPGLWIDHALDEVVAPQPETDNYLTLDADDRALTVRCFLPDGRKIDEAVVKKS